MGLLLAGWPLTGCYTYSFQERGGQDLARVPVDRNLTESRVRWATWWGLRQDNFAPIGCGDGEHSSGDPACRTPVSLCEYGMGEVTASMTWYSVLTMVGTLGVAMPQKITVFCVTARDFDPKPQPLERPPSCAEEPLAEPHPPSPEELGPPPVGP